MDTGEKINIKLLLHGCREGKQVSQMKVYRHFYSYGMSIGLRYAQNREEAMEIVNDGFLKVFTKIDQYDSEQPFKPWLRKIIIHAAIDYHRKYDKLQQPLDALPSGNMEDNVTNDALKNLAYEDALQIIQKLPPAYRMVFNLFVMEDFSHQDIADKLEINIGTSKSNLAKAKHKMKHLIKAANGFFPKSMGYE